MKIAINDGKYNYVEGDPWGDGSFGAPFAGVVAEVGKELIDLQTKIDALLVSHPLYRFHESIYVTGIIIEWDGVPVGTVRIVDDFPLFVAYKQSLAEEA